VPNFIKRKHPRKGEKKKQGATTKVQARQANSPKEVAHKEKMEPLHIRSSTSRMKHIN